MVPPSAGDAHILLFTSIYASSEILRQDRPYLVFRRFACKFIRGATSLIILPTVYLLIHVWRYDKLLRMMLPFRPGFLKTTLPVKISAIKEIVNNVHSEIKNAFLTRAWDICFYDVKFSLVWFVFFALSLYFLSYVELSSRVWRRSVLSKYSIACRKSAKDYYLVTSWWNIIAPVYDE